MSCQIPITQNQFYIVTYIKYTSNKRCSFLAVVKAQDRNPTLVFTLNLFVPSTTFAEFGEDVHIFPVSLMERCKFSYGP